MIKKISKKVKILIAVIFAVVLCAAAVTALCLASSEQANLVFKGHSTIVSFNKERKKEFHIGLSSAIADDKPYESDNEAMFYLKQLVYQPLIKINNDGSIKYLNALDITFADNGKTANVSVNNKMKFSNGENLSADIIINSYKYFMVNETAYDNVISNVLSVKKTGDNEVVFYFYAPKIDNIKAFAVPIILFDKNSQYALGTGCYAVDSIVYYGDTVLVKNEYAKENAKYKKVVLTPIDYKTVESLNADNAFDVFLFNKNSLGNAVQKCKAYNIFEISLDNGSYLIYNINNENAKNAVAFLASSQEFFKATQDNSIYSDGMLFAYMKKPNYHSLLKNGSLTDVNCFNIAYGYEKGAYSIFMALSENLKSFGVESNSVNVDLYETKQDINADIVIYNGRFNEVIDSDDNESFFAAYSNMNVKNYYFNLEKYFAKKNKVTPLAKDTVWYASLAGRNDLDLFD